MSDTDPLDRIKRRIAALFRKEGDASCTPEEAASAAALAARLMAEHRLTRAELERADPHSPETVMGQGHWTANTKTMPIWGWTLASAVADLIGTLGIYKSARPTEESNGVYRSWDCVVFYGPEADLDRAAEIMSSFFRLIAERARNYYGGTHKGEGRSFGLGFASALWQGVQTERAKPDMTSAVALYKSDQDLAKDWLVEEQGLKLRTKKASKITYKRTSFEHGHSEGQRNPLHSSPKVE